MLDDILRTLWDEFPLALLLVRAVILPISFTIHELAHGLVAALLGDPTPRESGRLTLNPFPHLESVGMITGVMVGVGWSRPTPIRPHRMRVPGWIGGPLAVLAGPFASLGIAFAGRAVLVAASLPLSYPWSGWPAPVDFLSVLVRFNLTLALLNLLPLFPLDAFQAIRFILPLRGEVLWERASGWTTAMLGVAIGSLLILPPGLLMAILGPPMRWGIDVLLGR